MFDDELENNNEEIIDVDAVEDVKSTKSKSKKASAKETVEDVIDVTTEDIAVTKTEKSVKEEIFMPEDNGIEVGKPVSKDGTVTVQPVKFASFDQMDQVSGEENKNLDILMDVKLQLNVELGRCELPIKKVLELTRGSIIELDKVAGESVELFANGKLIAQGEVVVIDDNFGLRITSITEPDNRIN
ncbi:flagellar motor switch protein FliN [bacterium]|nr:flagellar motor switch protein FliN [bacterium]